MADPETIDATMEDEYDEEADSDFDAGNAAEEVISSPSEEENDQTPSARQGGPRLKPQGKRKERSQPEPLDLDSGDEATIQEQNRATQKQQHRVEDGQIYNGDIEEQGWRARTRAMREKEEVDKKTSKLASVTGSTIDVEQMWKAMNKPDALNGLLQPAPALVLDGATHQSEEQKENHDPSRSLSAGVESGNVDESQELPEGINDMMMIDETYEFAGEVHSRKKTVPRSSAEAKLWLSQRSHHNSDPRFSGEEPVRRPLRKISRFDPNVNSLDSFQKNWERPWADGKGLKVHKLNTVEKSKMDWAMHVDQEGLQDELSEHAKAKGGYLGRMAFLGQVEQRKDEEARRRRVGGESKAEKVSF